MAFRVIDGEAYVDSVYFGRDGYGKGVRSLVVTNDNGKPIHTNEDYTAPLRNAGPVDLFGWDSSVDGKCQCIESDTIVGYWAVPAEQWAKVEAWLRA